MKNIQPVWLFLAILFAISCTEGQKETTAPVPSASQLPPMPGQKVPVVNKASATAPSNIGKRNAEEMVSAGFKRYGTEKGTLIFRMDGAVNGTEHIYFDHWGWREGKYVKSESDIGKYDKKTDKIQLLDGERRYEYLPSTGEAHFFESKQVQKAADQYGTTDMAIVGDEMIKKMGGFINGKNSIQGVECQVWYMEKYRTELSMWKGITLGERSHAEGIDVARTCILLDTFSAVPLDKITLPPMVKVIGID